MEKVLADTSFIELLINYGADINKPDGGGSLLLTLVQTYIVIILQEVNC